MAEVEFQVGDRVIYSGVTSPQAGTITKVHLIRSDASPDAVETRSYDIDLDNGGSIINTKTQLTPAP
jgi:hypothetical protein